MVNQGEKIMAEALVNKVAPQDLKLKLFQNNWTPADGNTESAVTEATFTGYTEISLSGANWVCTEGAPSQLTYPEQSFASSSDQTPQTIYGYYLVQATSGKLVCAWRFSDGPYTVSKNGDEIDITPKILVKKPGE